MLQQLTLNHVGPVEELTMELAPRINILAGDNGLGKSFLLDACWWTLTRTWASNPLMPYNTYRQEYFADPPTNKPTQSTITYKHSRTDNKIDHEYILPYMKHAQDWSTHPDIEIHTPNLAIYAMVNGNYAVWDTYRNRYAKQFSQEPEAYIIKQNELWHGNKYCNGLINDLVTWEHQLRIPFKYYKNTLATLSPDPNNALTPGDTVKVSVHDPTRYPTIDTHDGHRTPILHASAGLKRIVGMVYMLVWTWIEHKEACRIIGKSPIQDITILIDEPEAHLHPRWQRRILPALLTAINEMTEDLDVNIQLIAATHSPMVLASLEPDFNPDLDSVWELDRIDDKIQIQKFHFERMGDAASWLTSSVFDLGYAYSYKAEQALNNAMDIFRSKCTDPNRITEVEDQLKASLSATDPFWARWLFYKQQHLP